MAVMRGHLERSPEPIPGLDPELWSLIADMLSKRPADRPSGPTSSACLTRLLPRLEGLPPLPAVGMPGGPGMALPGAAPHRPGATVVLGRTDAGSAQDPAVAGLAGLSGQGLTNMGIRRALPIEQTAMPIATAHRRRGWYRPATLLMAPVVLVAALVAVFAARGHHPRPPRPSA